MKSAKVIYVKILHEFRPQEILGHFFILEIQSEGMATRGKAFHNLGRLRK